MKKKPLVSEDIDITTHDYKCHENENEIYAALPH